ncbi:hypothetical protein B0J13DRAFT_500867 [Dactylonectria estremocensis]|uniref:Uncharacterized protein n=1 Tax=Dactylonectria estremocensis TaxID=1079267 RepID=A0A9P9J315_9HYPO|nr:hypothetical protein B0J13DRAFT_500867 [Dactylonectria estremocensis]
MALPVRVRMAIRDHWDSPDCMLQRNLAWFRSRHNFDVSVSMPWSTMVKVHEGFYSDREEATRALANCVASWTQALRDLLESGMEDGLAEGLKSRGKIDAYPEMGESSKPSTTWSKDRDAFIIHLPNEIMPPTSELVSIFQNQIPAVFQPTHHLTSSAPAQAEGSGTVGVSRGFYNDAAMALSPTDLPPHTAGPTITKIPNVNDLPKPDQLLAKPPYYLILYAGVRTKVEVECSHTQTLVFLSEYLKQWCKANHDSPDKHVVVDVNLHPAAFGSGLQYDRLTLAVDDEDRSPFLVTPSVILALVEGVLGYSRVWVDGSIWTFRKGDILKK